MKNWRLLITRPAEENLMLGEKLSEQGVFSYSLPLLAMRELEETPAQRELMLNLDRYSCIVVVSKPAARYALARLDKYWPQPPLRPQWFSVGAATGQILHAAGLETYWPEDGDDSEALIRLPQFQQSLQQPAAKALIIRADQGRNFLSEYIRQQGITVDFLPLYQRFLPDYPKHMLINCVTEHQLNGLMVNSEQALLYLIEIAAQDWPKLSQLPLFTPSPRVAHKAQELGAQQVIDCAGASYQALHQALANNAALAT